MTWKENKEDKKVFIVTVILIAIMIGFCFCCHLGIRDAKDDYNNDKNQTEMNCKDFCSPTSYYFEYRLIGADVCQCKATLE